MCIPASKPRPVLMKDSKGRTMEIVMAGPGSRLVKVEPVECPIAGKEGRPCIYIWLVEERRER